MSRHKSRVHPRFKTKYRVGNWSSYDRSLVARGSVTLWLSPDAITAWTPAPTGRRGGPRKFSDLAIETALTLRLVFHLPLRQAEGFLQSLLGLMQLDLDAPDHTTLSRRSRDLAVRLRSRQTSEPMHRIVDSKEESILGGRLRTRAPAGQAVEARVACNILNRMTELERPESFAVGM